MSNLNFVDGLTWNIDNDSIQMDMNNRASNATWSTRDIFHTTHLVGSDANGEMSCMDCLMPMLTPLAVRHIVTLTNVKLSQMQGQDDVNVGVSWKFIGLLLIVTWLEFASCPDLWSLQNLSKFPPNICFERFGMTRKRFDAIWSALCFLC